MEEEIEDIIGEVKYTDSQKSVTTVTSSHTYSPDFTDSSSRSSEKNNSSDKETYVIGWDSEDSETTFPLHECVSTIITDAYSSFKKTVQCGSANISTKSASTSVQKCSVRAQEIHTQTSKTIIELAETDATLKKNTDAKTLETQTSFVSITENKTVEYMIEVTSQKRNAKNDVVNQHEFIQKSGSINVICNVSQDDESSKFPVSETENEVSEDKSISSSTDHIIRIVNDDSKETLYSSNELRFENISEFNESLLMSDMEEDSLEDRPKSTNEEIKELHDKLSVELDLCMSERYTDPDIRRFGTLTPLTEESNTKKESLMDITPNVSNISDNNENQDEVLFTSNSGIKVKLLNDDSAKNSFKLPPIQNHSCPNSPHLNTLFGKPKLSKAGTLPSLYERHNNQDRWEIATKNLASGESLLINGKESPTKRTGALQLPPIHGEVPTAANRNAMSAVPPAEGVSDSQDLDAINIREKIKELKMSAKRSNKINNGRKEECRSPSPVSMSSRCDSQLCDIADRGCETLCIELLRRLRLNSWMEVIETLEDIPKVLEKFWSVILEQRIADLIRQVTVHVESPRPQVARVACGTVAAILRNTNYTKKPDFYESVTSLLTKTGSYSRPVRRAANVALDDIVCGVELTHAVTALCVHGVTHKNALVRCAAARLLVVCCALASGGRDLLRARPATAATARRHALRALAALLDDKTPDVRKYAERLYSMLRPLANFEAYYLTDVEVEVASKQMKKYDQLLLGQPKEAR